MVTISHLARKIIEDKPYLHESLEKGLINLGALAQYIKPEIEKELKAKVKDSAISMAIRRYIDNPDYFRKISLRKKSELMIRSNLFEISMAKSPTMQSKVPKIFGVIDLDSGGYLNVVFGNFEVLILSNEKYREKILNILEEEKIKRTIKGISSVSIRIPPEFVHLPGFYSAITKMLSAHNISIIDIVNTETELTLILNDADISKAYNLLNMEINMEYYEK
jgi:aspartokinase